MATFDEAYATSLRYFEGDEIAAQKFVSKYALQDPTGDFEELTPDDMHRRLATEFARIEAKYPNPLSEEEIYGLLKDFRYVVPQGSPMAGIGNPYQVQSLSNCFVIGSPYDSYGGILKTDQEQVQIMKRRGGVGFDLSTIRPKDMKTANAARTTDGIAVFMERWSNSCREVAQGGRRGALMLTLSCHHPQIRDFISIKRDLKKVTGANISVRLTDEFMRAVRDGGQVQLRFPVESDAQHLVSSFVDARQLWDEIIDSAHNFAEPGLLFWDNIVSMSPADIYAPEGYQTLSTNPCLTGDSLIAVADGRGFVPFSELAAACEDVPVYAIDANGQTVVKMMRNPHLTSHNAPISRVVLEGNRTFRSTQNHKVKMSDGSYKAVHNIKIGEKLCASYDSSNILESSLSVVSVEFAGYADVFNGTVDEEHNYVFKVDDVLLNSKNCGELPLAPYDSCRLLLINLTSFVVDSFGKNAYINDVLFDDVVFKAQRLMDDVVDMEVESVDNIIAKIESDPEPIAVKQIEIDMWQQVRTRALNARRTGLGVTGFGDMVAALGLRYGSDESIKVADAVFKRLALATYRSSAILAKERGAFSCHDYQREKDHPFLRRLFDADPELEKLVRQYGRRNIACNTTSPAGSVSLLTQTTSGIENVFMISYKRRSKISNSDKNAEVSFVDEMGDRWQEFDVIHPGFKRWMQVTGKTLADIKESPYWMSTSADVDWLAKIKLQAAAQRWIDHAISNTTNIPENTPIDITKRIYMMGWELGCKGVTVYRAGSRTGVLISDSDPPKEQALPIKRPKELSCRIHHANVKNELWTILVGMLDGKPYEVFGGLSKYVEIPRKYDEGLITKNERKAVASTYDLKIGNGSGFVIKDIVNQFDNPNYSVMTRMISLSLRHGAKIQNIVEQLQKGDRDSDMFSFSKVIARVLKGYIEDGSETTIVKKCEGCGGSRFIYSEGCVSCADCRWSKC